MLVKTVGGTRVLWIMRDDGDMTEPMNIMLLSALGKQNRPWRSSHLALLERDDIIQVVRDIKPQIVAASTITGSHKYYLEALKAIKETFGDSVFTILGGPYCSTYPQVIAEQPFLDAIGVMECDDAWPEFLDAFENDRDAIHNIRNIITRENYSRVLLRTPIVSGLMTSGRGKPGEQFITTVDRAFYRDLRTDFDQLPYLDRPLVYDNTAFKNRFKRTHMAGRGCPFRCTYCFERDWNAMYKGKGKMLQRYSPVRFCEELQDVSRRYDTRFWKLYDDVFPTFKPDLPWLTEFAEVYPKMVGLPFHCLTRCDLVQKNPEVLDLLKKAGIASLTMSIESGNNFIRDHVITRDMEEEEIRFAFARARKLGIETFSNTILGIPGPKLPCADDPNFDERVAGIVQDSKFYRVVKKGKVVDFGKDLEAATAEIPDEASRREITLEYLSRAGIHRTQSDYERESVRFTIDCNVSFGEFTVLYPYPRTAATEYLVHKGYFDGNFDKLHASYQNRSPLECFTDKEKNLQQNLALLASFCMLFSGSRNRFMNMLARPVTAFCVNVLALAPYGRITRFYQWLYSISKGYMHGMRIYPMRRSVRERFIFYMEMWDLDIWKHFAKGKRKKLLLRGERPGQTLGGPPSV